jgi:hypothetical protein
LGSASEWAKEMERAKVMVKETATVMERVMEMAMETAKARRAGLLEGCLPVVACPP